MKGLEGNKGYSGVALTLIDSLSTLAVIGDAVNFEKSVLWLSKNVRPHPSALTLGKTQIHTRLKRSSHLFPSWAGVFCLEIYSPVRRACAVII